MPIFTISFDRRNPEGNHDYDPLFKELQAQKCFPLFQNAWLGSFNNNAPQVHDHFRKLLHEADVLVVSEMIDHFSYSNVVQGANRWLELNPPASRAALNPAQPAQPAAVPQAAAEKAPAKKAAAKKEAAPAEKDAG